MSEFFNHLLYDILVTSVWEWIAVVSGIGYVIFAMFQKNICWLFAFISSGMYVYLCINAQLYLESTLQLFYVIMAVVGWVTWLKMSTSTEDHDLLDTLPAQKTGIQVFSFRFHAINILVSAAVAFLVGLSFDVWTNQATPYLDAFTTVFSLVATYLVVKKTLGNWIYWIVIDVVSIALYANRGYGLTATLYFTFTLLAIAGFFKWRKAYKNQAI